jgi:hypothetical protein
MAVLGGIVACERVTGDRLALAADEDFLSKKSRLVGTDVLDTSTAGVSTPR